MTNTIRGTVAIDATSIVSAIAAQGELIMSLTKEIQDFRDAANASLTTIEAVMDDLKARIGTAGFPTDDDKVVLAALRARFEALATVRP